MSIAWYLLIGIFWLVSLYIVFYDAFNVFFPKSIRRQKLIHDIIPALIFTVIALIIALLPNFIGAAIQWIISLLH